MAIRVLVAANYASVRAGLHALLADASDFEVIGEVSGSGDMERLMPMYSPDVILCETTESEIPALLEAMEGSEAALVLLSESRTAPRLLANAELPGWAYLRREADRAEIIAATLAASSGLVVLDRSFVSLLRPSLLGGQDARDESDYLPGESLTAREREVLLLMAQGLANKQIATRLAISQHTVKFHVASILAKLGAASRTEAVTLGARRGHIPL